MAQLVTGEAVVLELRLATLASRALAAAVDLVVQVAALALGLLILGGVVDNVDVALGAAIALVLTVSVILGYPVTMETLTRGRSLGKMALGLRVVRDDGGAIRFRHALMRGLLGVLEFWLTQGVVAVLASLVSGRGKRLGDALAGTVVIRERQPARKQDAAHATMPPELAGWATQLDLTRLPDSLASAARQYLSRQDQLAPETREAMGRSLADSVAAAVTPAAPPGVSAPNYLAAVLSERRRRELDRLHRPSGIAPLPGPRPATPPYVAPPAAGSPPPPTAPAGRPRPTWTPPGGPFTPPG